MNRNILIGGAWPYANGPLHIGHMAALVPGDVLARYHRQNGDFVVYVSGSDCHGTPIAVRAQKEGVSPSSIAQQYHEEFADCFQRMEFTYSEYENTMIPEHEQFVRDYFVQLIQNGSLYEKEINQVYCEHCHKFLPDRYVTGICPVCGSEARGDQCDACGSLLEPEQMSDIKCAICGIEPTLRPSAQLYLSIVKHKDTLRRFVDEHAGIWRQNAWNESNKYLSSGLQDRAATRDIDWGIEVPYKSYDNKRIYVWFEAVLGYLSMAAKYCREQGVDFLEFWNNSFHYYVHGKDNIPFHTIILPSLLLSHGDFKLPDMIVSSEYMTLEGRKISTSRNWAIWIPYLLDYYNPDSIRLYFVAFGPETKDADFSWQNFINFHNSQLVGAYGNFVNRTLAFINKYGCDVIPKGTLAPEIEQSIQDTYAAVSADIEHAAFREAINKIFALVNYGNKYYDEQKPWVSRTEAPDACNNVMFNCTQLIANLAVMFAPFIPGSSEKIAGWLGTDLSWKMQKVPAGTVIPAVEILYNRIDKKQIAVEIERLKKNAEGK